jgi:hypothetical protein
MDILYYSNNCKHSQNTIQFFVKNNLVDKLNFINLDKRRIDSVSGQVYVILEDGKEILLPPNVHSVPALLLVKENYRVIFGEDILKRYQASVDQEKELATHGNGEPMGFVLGGLSTGVASESFTFFQATAEDLSAKGSGGLRPLNNYVSVRDESSQYTIHTPPETYKSQKLGGEVTVDKLEQKRSAEIGMTTNPPLFLPPSSTTI